MTVTKIIFVKISLRVFYMHCHMLSWGATAQCLFWDAVRAPDIACSLRMALPHEGQSRGSECGLQSPALG